MLLTGTFLFGNSGDETDYANTYSGVYVDIPGGLTMLFRAIQHTGLSK